MLRDQIRWEILENILQLASARRRVIGSAGHIGNLLERGLINSTAEPTAAKSTAKPAAAEPSAAKSAATETATPKPAASKLSAKRFTTLKLRAARRKL